jgi:hypothetical protein
MSAPIIYIDKSSVREGKLNELKVAIEKLVAFVESHVPRSIAYNVYLSADGTQMTVVQTQPDSASLEFHMDIGRAAFAKFESLIRLTAIEIYGEPSDGLRQRLLERARMLGGSEEIITFHKRQAGFTRGAIELLNLQVIERSRKAAAHDRATQSLAP